MTIYRKKQDPDVCTAVADQLSAWLEFGEPLADWVAGQASEHGIDVDSSIATSHNEGT